MYESQTLMKNWLFSINKHAQIEDIMMKVRKLNTCANTKLFLYLQELPIILLKWFTREENKQLRSQ